MPLLREQDRTALAEIFSHQLQDPVTVDLFTQRAPGLIVPGYECQTCRETNELLGEVAGLSKLITLHMYDFMSEADEAKRARVDRIPALVFHGRNRGVMRYFGVPAGYEFSVLVEGLIDASRGTTRLAPTTRQQMADLSTPVHIKVLVTPT